ncbi:hypothetical protein N7495_004979 [Penicillium taxi]|uniref:uncharacterized protein n=1 Tax=Penicillium taxi TaxID=168475 RepID=UPI0025458078|nr:uncharacterized protein N7495_004979 [Penicillium taxi]KAJ5893288.1 hypothetical protein N7495_004979 [Penicillium taxi]
MHSMRYPLGRSDPRVSEVDSPIDYILSPFFSSVLEISDLPSHEQRFYERELTPLELDMKRKKQSLSASTSKPYASGRNQFSTLKSNVGMDKYLDGTCEPMNPQNTPAEFDSPIPGEASYHSTVHKRISFAPQMQQLDINWFHDKPEESLLYDVGEGVKSSSIRQRSASLEFSSQTGSSEIDSCDRRISPMISFGELCVQLSPATSPFQSSSQQQLLPSVELEQDYISSYQQKKYKENWRDAISCPKQGSPLHSSPVKTTQPPMKAMNRQPDICFSPLSKILGQDGGSSMTSQVTPQPHVPELSKALVQIPCTCKDKYRDYFVNFEVTLYRVQFGSHPRPLAYLQFQSPMICKETLQTFPRDSYVGNRPLTSGVFLHIPLPPYLIRLLLNVVSVMERLSHSHEGRVTLSIVTLFWSWITRLVNYLLSLLGLRAHYDHDFGAFWGLLLGVWPNPDRQGPKWF